MFMATRSKELHRRRSEALKGCSDRRSPERSRSLGGRFKSHRHRQPTDQAGPLRAGLIVISGAVRSSRADLAETAYDAAQHALAGPEGGLGEQVGEVLALGHQLDGLVLVGPGEALDGGDVVARHGGLDLTCVVGVELVELVDQTHDSSSGAVLRLKSGGRIGTIQFRGTVILVPPRRADPPLRTLVAMDAQTFLNFGLVVLFVLFGGVFAATEIALVSLRESQISAMERASTRGARVAAVARNPNRFLAAVQIGVTVAGFFSAAYGGSTLAPDLAPYLEDLGLGEDAAQTTALVLLTLLIAYLSLVLGELVPKRLALQKAAGVSLAVAPVLDTFATVMRPVIWLLSLSTNALVRLLGGDPNATSEQLSEEELRDLVSTHEDLNEQERRILSDVFAATDTNVKEVMRPRGDVSFVDGTLPLPAAALQVRALPYSRYPITGEDFDDVIGFLHVRDLLGVTPDDTRTVSEIARPILTLPGSKPVLPTVAIMREEGVHLAVVVDEYGGTDGIVTLEDIVEELIGEIRDEYDVADAGARDPLDLADIDGRVSIDDFARSTGIPLPEGSYETVAGYAISVLGHIPEPGEHVTVTGGTLEVTEVVGSRVTRLTLHREA